ncbi:hypothetical protein [Micromonospora sp. ATA51]|uniref:hypothetical protein n=1 Tax=Micromonospora sp. ATA51 TaxID=2806098 RepID=UPI001A441601|nr:hypothetical protein [Micromonospora sp. ATA51]MBM0227656.1 hypothetical protein [Micromonospora sp. ATA51]
MFASPEAYQSEPSAASTTSPLDRVGSWSVIGVQLPPPIEDRHTPPSAPAA